MIVMGHRGDPMFFPENTMEGFESALNKGADGIELDLRPTKDGALVVFHDNAVARTAFAPGRIGEMTLEDVQKLRLADGSSIPTVDDVLDAFAHRCRLHLELKSTNVLAAEVLAQKLKRLKEPNLVISSSVTSQLMHLGETFPLLPKAFVWGPEFHWPNFRDLSPLLAMQATGCNIIHPWIGFVNESFMDQAKIRGWEVMPYISLQLNEEANKRDIIWSKLKCLQVDGLCTNYPGEFRKWNVEVDQLSAQIAGEYDVELAN